MVERSPVKRSVRGSSPRGGALRQALYYRFIRYSEAVLWIKLRISEGYHAGELASENRQKGGFW